MAARLVFKPSIMTQLLLAAQLTPFGKADARESSVSWVGADQAMANLRYREDGLIALIRPPIWSAPTQ